MFVVYSCIDQDAVVFCTDKNGKAHLDGCGTMDANNVFHDRLSCNDGIWIVPGTVQP